MGASAKLDHGSLRVDPGGEVRGQITVRNSGTVVDQFSLEVLGDAAGWATLEPASLSLFPGAEGSAAFIIRPPRLWSTRPGTMAIGIRAASKEDPAGSAVEEGTLEVGSFTETSAEISPRTSHGRFGATHEVLLDNRGNLPVEAAVAGSDEDRQLRFATTPPSTIVDPGSAGVARLRVRPTKRFWRGPARTRRFQVAVEPVGGTPIKLEGAFLHDAILPSWIFPALAALLALAILALFFWFAFLRPAVENAAGQKAAQVLSSAGIPVPSAGPPSSSGGGAPSPGPKPSGGGGGSTPTGPGPTDGRLTPATPITIAAGQTLHITDLIFGNPQGASGSLDLVRNGTILLDLRLDNFRDLDYHFVTPIQVGAGETLQLNASCAPGCAPSVFYTGFVSVP
jgi:hypothetical protein